MEGVTAMGTCAGDSSILLKREADIAYQKWGWAISLKGLPSATYLLALSSMLTAHNPQKHAHQLGTLCSKHEPVKDVTELNHNISS